MISNNVREHESTSSDLKKPKNSITESTYVKCHEFQSKEYLIVDSKETNKLQLTKLNNEGATNRIKLINRHIFDDIDLDDPLDSTSSKSKEDTTKNVTNVLKDDDDEFDFDVTKLKDSRPETLSTGVSKSKTTINDLNDAQTDISSVISSKSLLTTILPFTSTENNLLNETISMNSIQNENVISNQAVAELSKNSLEHEQSIKSNPFQDISDNAPLNSNQNQINSFCSNTFIFQELKENLNDMTPNDMNLKNMVVKNSNMTFIADFGSENVNEGNSIDRTVDTCETVNTTSKATEIASNETITELDSVRVSSNSKSYEFSSEVSNIQNCPLVIAQTDLLINLKKPSRDFISARLTKDNFNNSEKDWNCVKPEKPIRNQTISKLSQKSSNVKSDDNSSYINTNLLSIDEKSDTINKSPEPNRVTDQTSSEIDSLKRQIKILEAEARVRNRERLEAEKQHCENTKVWENKLASLLLDNQSLQNYIKELSKELQTVKTGLNERNSLYSNITGSLILYFEKCEFYFHVFQCDIFVCRKR
jgi:hypothetical protein